MVERDLDAGLVARTAQGEGDAVTVGALHRECGEATLRVEGAVPAVARFEAEHTPEGIGREGAVAEHAAGGGQRREHDGVEGVKPGANLGGADGRRGHRRGEAFIAAREHEAERLRGAGEGVVVEGVGFVEGSLARGFELCDAPGHEALEECLRRARRCG